MEDNSRTVGFAQWIMYHTYNLIKPQMDSRMKSFMKKKCQSILFHRVTVF